MFEGVYPKKDNRFWHLKTREIGTTGVNQPKTPFKIRTGLQKRLKPPPLPGKFNSWSFWATFAKVSSHIKIKWAGFLRNPPIAFNFVYLFHPPYGWLMR